MLNFDFRRTSKKCSKSDRLLQPAEEYYSALVGDELESQRLDFAVESWDGPPENCLGWWKSKMPVDEKGRIYWAPRSVLLAYFEHVQQQPVLADVAYVVALLLVQKKIVSLDESVSVPSADVLYVKNRKTNVSYEIPVIEIAPSRMGEIQNELAEQLFTDQTIGDDEMEDSNADELN